MLEDYFLIVVCVAVLAGLAFVVAGFRQPMLFYYGGLFGTAVLKTPELPVVREKVTIVEVCMLLLWLCWPLLAKGRIRSVMVPQILRLGGAFCVVCLTSSLLATLTAPPALQSPKMTAYSLLEAINYCYGVAILWTTVNVLDTWQRWIGAIAAWLAGMTLASGVGVAAVVGVAPGWAYEETGRINSTLKNENQVPSMILPTLLVAILAAVRIGGGGAARLAMLGVAGAAMLTAIGTGSRTAALMIVLAGVGVYWVVASATQVRQVVQSFILANLAVVLSGLVVFYFWFAWSRYDGEYSLVKTPSWQRPAVLLIEWYSGSRNLDDTRPRQIRNAMEYFWNSPVLGTGPKYGSYYAETGGEVHNTYFSLMLETGFLGLGCFLSLIALAFWEGYRRGRQCPYPWFAMLSQALLVGLLLLCLYNATILGLRQRNIWFLLGMIYAFCDLVAAGAVPSPVMPHWLPRGAYAFFYDTPSRPGTMTAAAPMTIGATGGVGRGQ
ncbi:O-antigen ligase family protein [Crateriforma conspicua]|uniref:O-antigen ligase family protein n=1 Tax=Crateriforma conspicua TaxID=2527996 RepID=UPI001187E7F4|nr:O-antigen ligase family protein [Crateriforma conspicua]QDV65948.1 O-Antigen ligase [Crateriforma conspicua]